MKIGAAKKRAVQPVQPAQPTSGILGLFPLIGKTPRPAQAEAIEAVAAAFESGRRFVLLEGPPGLGKSGAAMTLARHFGNTWVCTLTKQLQEQYVREFEHLKLKELKGRAAFQCAPARDTCEVGGHYYTGRNACQACPYREAKIAALAAPITVCNYYSFLYNVDSEEDSTRPLLVLDEVHEVERVLLDYVSVGIRLNKLPFPYMAPLPSGTDPKVYFSWLGKLMEALKSRAYVSAEDKADAEKLRRRIAFALRRADSEEWIVELHRDEGGFDLKPLTVSSFGKMLFQHAERVLLMSATILDPDSLASSLGISADEYAFVQAPCTFPAENRPVFVGNLDMRKQARDESWPIMVDVVMGLLDRHPDEKGLLLTPSNEMLTYVQREMARKSKKHAARLILAFGDDRMAKYREHLTTKRPTVLAASGLWEGVDLKDELSRFQIIPALPRPFWGGQIEARVKRVPLGDRWYRWKTLTRLIQGTGRSVRSETDTATTYILDGAFRTEVDKPHNCMVPGWLKEAVTYVDE